MNDLKKNTYIVDHILRERLYPTNIRKEIFMSYLEEQTSLIYKRPYDIEMVKNGVYEMISEKPLPEYVLNLMDKDCQRTDTLGSLTHNMYVKRAKPCVKGR